VKFTAVRWRCAVETPELRGDSQKSADFCVKINRLGFSCRGNFFWHPSAIAFTRQILVLLSDGDYRMVPAELAANPPAGEVISDGGGIRKYRFALPGMGKRVGGG